MKKDARSVSKHQEANGATILPGRLALLSTASRFKGTTNGFAAADYAAIAAFSHSWLQSDLLPWLATRLSINEASLYSVKVCVSELFNNIQDHTRYDIGSIFIQHFPNEDCVIFSVADFGLGIPDKVRSKVPEISDTAAIIKTVEEGFTTKSSPAN